MSGDGHEGARLRRADALAVLRAHPPHVDLGAALEGLSALRAGASGKIGERVARLLSEPQSPALFESRVLAFLIPLADLCERESPEDIEAAATAAQAWLSQRTSSAVSALVSRLRAFAECHRLRASGRVPAPIVDLTWGCLDLREPPLSMTSATREVVRDIEAHLGLGTLVSMLEREAPHACVAIAPSLQLFGRVFAEESS